MAEGKWIAHIIPSLLAALSGADHIACRLQANRLFCSEIVVVEKRGSREALRQF
jgi:hypothetical protein